MPSQLPWTISLLLWGHPIWRLSPVSWWPPPIPICPFTRRGTRKLLPLGCPKSNQGDRAGKTAQLILQHLKCREIRSSTSFTRRGTRKLLPPGCPKTNQGDRATKTAELILKHLKIGMLRYFKSFCWFYCESLPQVSVYLLVIPFQSSHKMFPTMKLLLWAYTMYDISFADAGKSGPVRRGTRKLLPPGYPKSNQGDRATKTAEIILKHLKIGMLR